MLGQEVLEFMNIPDRLPGLREQNLNLYRAQRGVSSWWGAEAIQTGRLQSTLSSVQGAWAWQGRAAARDPRPHPASPNEPRQERQLSIIPPGRV